MCKQSREVFAELKRRGFRGSARRGQNFLFDTQLLDAFLDDAEVKAEERILEVGSGPGTLTRCLLRRGCEVLAVEIDEVLYSFVQDSLSSPRLRLLHSDALESKNCLSGALLEALKSWHKPYRLVANLPYAIATPLVQLLLASDPLLRGFAVLVQKQAAERWCAERGSPQYGAISVLLSLYGEGGIRRRVNRAAFIPSPQVDAAFYVWQRRVMPEPELEAAHQLCRTLFLKRRKMLRVLLKAELPAEDPWWGSVSLDPCWRPQDVPPEGFVAIFRELRRRRGEASRKGFRS